MRKFVNKSAIFATVLAAVFIFSFESFADGGIYSEEIPLYHDHGATDNFNISDYMITK